jgi:hypothetical protein
MIRVTLVILKALEPTRLGQSGLISLIRLDDG